MQYIAFEQKCTFNFEINNNKNNNKKSVDFFIKFGYSSNTIGLLV